MGENLRVRPINRLAVRATPVDLPEPPLVRNAALTAGENLAYPPRKGSHHAVPAKTAPTATARREIVLHAHLAINQLGVTAPRNPMATARKEIVLRKTLVPAKTVPTATVLREIVLHAHLAINLLGVIASRNPMATARKEIVPHAHLAINQLGVTAPRNPTATARKEIVLRKTLVPAKTAPTATARKEIVPHAHLAISLLGEIRPRNPSAPDPSAEFEETANTGKRSSNSAANPVTRPRKSLLHPRTTCV